MQMMPSYCTQNTDRQDCTEETCCMKKSKCETCDDNGFYYVHGIIEERVRFDCECNAVK